MSSDNDLALITGSNAELNLLATISTIFRGADIPVLPSHELQEATINNAELHVVLQRVTDGWEPKSAVATELRPYFDVWNTLSRSDDGLLMKESMVVIPCSLRHRALELAHEGHPGIVKMKQRCRLTIWWPGVYVDFERCVQHCVPCAVSGNSTRATPAPLQSIPFPLHSCGHRYFWRSAMDSVITAFPYRTLRPTFKPPEVATSSHVTSDTVITFLKDTFYRHGLSEVIISDNDPQFRSADFAAILKAHGI